MINSSSKDSGFSASCLISWKSLQYIPVYSILYIQKKQSPRLYKVVYLFCFILKSSVYPNIFAYLDSRKQSTPTQLEAASR